MTVQKMTRNFVEYTESGHLKGMLDRDQRTTKLRYNRGHPETVLIENICEDNVQRLNSTRCASRKLSHRHFPRRTGSQFSYRTRENSYSWKSLLRLKHVLIVGVYLSLINVPGSLSAPTSRPMDTERMNSNQKWINPCGFTSDSNVKGGEMYPVNITNLLNQLVRAATISHSRGSQFLDQFVRETFNTDFDKQQETWKNQRYPWLPTWDQIPKHLGKDLPEEHLASLKLDQALLDTYGYLQRVAVGLEQVTWDQIDEHGAFATNFTHLEDLIRAVLCEFETVIYDLDLQGRIINITRDVMPDEYRTYKDNTERNFRDWIIYRDTLNVLEYAMQAFEYLKTKQQ